MEDNEIIEEFNEDNEVLENSNEIIEEVEEIEETSEDETIIDKLVDKLDKLLNGDEEETEEEETEEEEEEEIEEEEENEEEIETFSDTEITSDSDYLYYIYQEIKEFKESYTEVQQKEVPTIFDKPINEYSVSESLLLSIFVLMLISVFVNFIKENVWRWK